MILNYKIDPENARILKPRAKNFTVDIVNDFAWTLSPKESREDVPYAHLIEYQQKAGQLIAGMAYYYLLYNQGILNPFNTDEDPASSYKYKFIADPTGWSYRFPYFSKQHTTRKNSFGYEQSDNPFSSLMNIGSQLISFNRGLIGGAGGFGRVAGTAAAIGTGAQAVKALADSAIAGKINFEHPKNWSSTSEESITITFQLANTQSIDDVHNNRRFAHLFRHNNTPSRKNFAIVDPPVIYSLIIPDIIHMPACYVSDLQITSLGNTRILNGKTIPEAYGFSITLTSLFMPTRNILEALDKGEIVKSMASKREIFSALIEQTKKELEALDPESETYADDGQSLRDRIDALEAYSR